MNRFRLSKESIADLSEIWDYIAEDNLDSADRLLDKFYETFADIAERPTIGHKREDLTSQNVLFWPIDSYLVIYKPDSSPLQIVAVLHGRRNVKSILRKR